MKSSGLCLVVHGDDVAAFISLCVGLGIGNLSECKLPDAAKVLRASVLARSHGLRVFHARGAFG